MGLHATAQFTNRLLRTHLNYDGLRGISTIGFIGLGNMGNPMAKNLLQKGFQVTVYDIDSNNRNSLTKDGAKIANSIGETASNVDCVITMLPNNQAVLDSYSGKNGVFDFIQKDAVLIDSSTVDPLVSKTLGPLAKKKGAIFLDTPVSGGVMAAQSGQLTFMVGGPEEGVKLVDKVLHAMGRSVIYCGPYGSGQVAKICNNMLLAISMAGLAEAMNLGVRLGLDPKLLTAVINCSSGRCWSSDVYNPVPNILENAPSSRDYNGGFGTKLLLKDLNLAKDVANRSASPTLLGKLALEMYQDIVDSGQGDRDFSIIYDFMKNNKYSTK